MAYNTAYAMYGEKKVKHTYTHSMVPVANDE